MKPDGLIAKDKFFPMLQHGKICWTFCNFVPPARKENSWIRSCDLQIAEIFHITAGWLRCKYDQAGYLMVAGTPGKDTFTKGPWTWNMFGTKDNWGFTKHNWLSFCYRMLMVAVCFQEPDSWFGHANNLHWNHWRHSHVCSGVKLIWQLGVAMSIDHFGTSKSIRTSLDSLPIWNLRWQVQHSLVGPYPWPCLHTALGTRSSWRETAATTKPLGGPWMDGRLER